jgi:hypothetical protein
MVALVAVLSVPVAEVAYRLAGTQVAATMTGIYRSYGDGGYRLRSDADVLQNWASGAFWVHTDARGFRVGREGPTGTTPDVLVLGDSQAFGQGLEFEETVVGRFAHRAFANGLQVVNAAVGGHSVKDQIELVRTVFAEGLRPRLVLLCLTPRMLAYPDALSRFLVEDGDLWDGPPRLVGRVRRFLSTHSAVYVVLRNALRRGEESRRAADLLPLYDTGPLQGPRLESLHASMATLAAVCREVGARIVLCYLPLAFDANIDEVAKAMNAQASSSAPLQTVRSLGIAAGLPVIDATPALEAVRQRRERVTLVGDSHYGPATSREVADVLWNAVDWRAGTPR